MDNIKLCEIEIHGETISISSDVNSKYFDQVCTLVKSNKFKKYQLFVRKPTAKKTPKKK